MKQTKMAFAAAITCILFASQAFAQEIQQPASIKQVALSYGYYNQTNLESNNVETSWVADLETALQPSPSDQAAPSAAGGAACAASCEEEDVCWGDPCRLIGDTCNCWNIYGWLEFGYTGNARNPVSHYNGPNSFNDRDTFQMNQSYLVMEKEVDRDSCCWNIGGRVDLLFGTDYIFTQSTGLETRDNGAPHWNGGPEYGLALPQAYLEIARGGLSAKIGHFYTILGYESVMAPENFFYSHAYTMQYGEPFTHTGVLFSWERNECTTFHAGFVNGWDKFDAETDQFSFLGGVNYSPCTCWDLAFSFTTGLEDGTTYTGANGLNNRTAYSLVWTYHINSCWDYVLQHDLGHENGVGGTADTDWYGVNQYLFREINCCWKAGFRFEWFKDEDGSRVAGTRATNPNVGPYEGDFFALSAGLNWTPNANVTVRPEIRWDWFDGIGLPYDDGGTDDQFTAAIDAIIQF